jgi:multiple sugar transport system ATP-binding protein
VRQPEIFLFDEPLSNLDAALRSEMRVELMGLHKKLGSTMIYVTHDQVEAMTMADKIVVMNQGVIEQIGSPLELYNAPGNLFVAGFIGSPKMNFLTGTITVAAKTWVTVTLAGGTTVDLKRTAAGRVGEAVTLGIRPEHLRLGAGEVTLTIEPRLVEHLGIHTVAYADLPGADHFIALFEGSVPVTAGTRVEVGFNRDAAHLFDSAGQAIA